MNNDVQVVFSPELYMLQLGAMQDELNKRDREIQRLTDQLDYERSLRERLEAKYGKLSEEEMVPKKTRKRREVTPDDNAYSDFKSDGKRKPHAADAIRSYDDFHAIQDYYLEKGQVRDWSMWTIGVSLG